MTPVKATLTCEGWISLSGFVWNNENVSSLPSSVPTRSKHGCGHWRHEMGTEGRPISDSKTGLQSRIRHDAALNSGIENILSRPSVDPHAKRPVRTPAEW